MSTKPRFIRQLNAAALCGFFLSICVLVPPAAAMDFQVELAVGFGSLASEDSLDQDHKMLHVVKAAANYWERVFAGVGETYRVKCKFKHNDSRSGEFEVNRLVGGAYKIKFYIGSDGYDTYYIDDSPNDHSEFAMEQTVHHELNSADANDGFDGSPETYLEVTYAGDAGESSDAADRIDLYTQALGALAGVMGFRLKTFGRSLAEQEISDDCEYNIVDGFNAGDYLAVNVRRGSGCGSVMPSPVIGGIALEVDSLLVESSYNVGRRYLPSTVDVIVVATINGWIPTDVWLPRVDMRAHNMISSTSGSSSWTMDWHDTENWIGGRVPEDFTEAFLRESLGEVRLEADAEAGGVHLYNGNDLVTNGYDLSISGPIGVYNAASLLAIEAGDKATGQLLTIQAGSVEVHDAEFTFQGTPRREDGRPYGQIVEGGVLLVQNSLFSMDDGILDVEDGVLRLSENADIRLADLTTFNRGSTGMMSPTIGIIKGDGTISQITKLVNNGLIQPIGDLVMYANPSGCFDLDGDESTSSDLDGDESTSSSGDSAGDAGGSLNATGEIDATAGSLYIVGEIADDFNGLLTVADGEVVELTHDLTIGDSGEIRFEIGSSTDAGKVKASALTISGSVYASTIAVLQSDYGMEFQDGAHVEVSSDLALKGPVTYNGSTADFVGSGRLYQLGDAIVNADTTIETSTYIWDGESASFLSSGPSETTIKSGREFTITGSISITSDGPDGVVTLESDAKLIMQRDWQLDGTMWLKGGTVVTGDGSGTLTIDGTGVIVGEGEIDGHVFLITDSFITATGSGIYITGCATGDTSGLSSGVTVCCGCK